MLLYIYFGRVFLLFVLLSLLIGRGNYVDIILVICVGFIMVVKKRK